MTTGPATARLAPITIRPNAARDANTQAYPVEARARGEQGDVLIELELDPTGAVRQARLKRGSGHVSLDQGALRSARQMRFKPPQTDASWGGAQVTAPILVEVPFAYRLD